MYHKRKYKPIYPEKYEGDPTSIIMRSSWETRFALWCDRNPAIVKWSSEETIIPYRCHTDNRIHRYFVDFRIKVKQTDGSIKTYIVEIKPHAQTKPPEYPGRKTKRFITESLTFVKNQSKWKAAEEWCKDRGYEFKIITERELGI
jgi:hypothetical protein